MGPIQGCCPDGVLSGRFHCWSPVISRTAGIQGTGAVPHHLDLDQACHFPGSIAVVMMIRLSPPAGLRPIAGMAQKHGRLNASILLASLHSAIISFSGREPHDHEDHQKNWKDLDDCTG
jgi:hypothetical protein